MLTKLVKPMGEMFVARAAVSTASGTDSYPPSVSFQDVTVAYHGTVVLDSLTLSVPRWSILALLGPSGSGKTTALRCVAGFVRPVRGKIYLEDRDVTGLPPHQRGVGLVQQHYALFPHMTVFENVAFGLKARRVCRSVITNEVERLLQMIGLARYGDRYPRQLSGGQQQRIAVARALAIKPSILLLDEPLSALDAHLRGEMMSEIAALHRRLPDLTMIYVTHDQTEALALADRIAVMNEAHLVEEGTSQQLYQHPQTAFTARFLTNANLLAVEVIAAGDAHVGAHLRFGESLIRMEHAWDLDLNSTKSASVCLFPDHVSFVRYSETDNELRGRVTEMFWRGSTYHFHALVAGQTIKVVTSSPDGLPRVGDDVTIYFSPHDITAIAAG